MAEIVCPVCGEIKKSDVTLYDIELRKMNFDISPIHPICNHCKSTVNINKKCHGGEIIILNGTCGSGKSTIAIELMKYYGVKVKQNFHRYGKQFFQCVVRSSFLMPVSTFF